MRLRWFAGTLYTPPVPQGVIVVSDAHLGFAPESVTRAFHCFLEAVPSLGDHLVVNGDLFEFWFEYRAVIPRAAFSTLEALAAVRRTGVRITVTGGNHDRWGGEFWRRDLGAEFHEEVVDLDLAGFKALVSHGDGVGDEPGGARLMHAVTRHPLTARVFRWIHPDVGLALVRRMSPFMAGKTRDQAVIQRFAEQQADYARRLLARRPDLDLVVLGHTHRSALIPVGERRWYLNPGAWMDGYCYAMITPEGPTLERFETAGTTK
ncbi:MAG: hypothetical protein GTN62_08810 [Gemmatimonadales bacterium]|nr:hypothetical protein [Gemmatimonadales bacterium]NIN50196.1 hypothetical protein [Gemmatimonadales bacterium]NIP07660.1 hypothetical protein [Gemmatimonadales bacterium]NIR01812.1 hypothetical protein [Gemmatimonadales bacterium]NIS65715.1 hypothetical protein [Gemmatimonadales bacterium]